MNVTQSLTLSGFVLAIGIYATCMFKTYRFNNKINDLNNRVTELSTDLSKYKLKYDRATVIVTNKDNYISKLENEVKTLNTTIDKYNHYVDTLKATTDDLNNKLSKMNKYKNLARKYKTRFIKLINSEINYSKATCEEGLKLNKAIAKIKYKDL